MTPLGGSPSRTRPHPRERAGTRRNDRSWKSATPSPRSPASSRETRLFRAAFDEVEASLAQVTQMWSEAQSVQKSGNLASAVSKAMGGEDVVVKFLPALNMPVPEALRT